MNSNRKVIYKCAVSGCLGRIGKAFALCAKSGTGGKCAAHGNKKCEHKIKEQKKR